MPGFRAFAMSLDVLLVPHSHRTALPHSWFPQSLERRQPDALIELCAHRTAGMRSCSASRASASTSDADRTWLPDRSILMS